MDVHKNKAHTIWSFMVFPSCSTVRIFLQRKKKWNQWYGTTVITLSMRIIMECIVLLTYKVDPNGAYITLNIWIILHNRNYRFLKCKRCNHKEQLNKNQVHVSTENKTMQGHIISSMVVTFQFLMISA